MNGVTSAVILMAAVLPSLLRPVTSTSDPTVMFCDEVCAGLEQQRQLCEIQYSCDVETMAPWLFRRCTSPCRKETTACRRICGRNFHRIFGQCLAECQGMFHDSCRSDCFGVRMGTHLDWVRSRNDGNLHRPRARK